MQSSSLRTLLAILFLYAIRNGKSDDQVNHVAIVLEYPDGSDADSNREWSEMGDLLKSRSIPYRTMILAKDEKDDEILNTTTITYDRLLANMTGPERPGELEITDVTDLDLNDDGGSNRENAFDISTLESSTPSDVIGATTKLLFIDPCEGMSDVEGVGGNKTKLYDQLFNTSIVFGKFFGYFINFTTQFNLSDPVGLHLTTALKRNMTVDREYLLRIEKPTDWFPMSKITLRLCNGFIVYGKRYAINGSDVQTTTTIDIGSTSTIDANETSSTSIDESSTTTASPTDSTTTTSMTTTVIIPSIEQSTTIQNDTTVTPSTSVETKPSTPSSSIVFFNTTTTPTSIEAKPIPRSNAAASTSLALGLIIAIIIITVVTFLLRKRIAQFVRTKIRARRNGGASGGEVEEPTSGYGSLHNEYDMEDFGRPREGQRDYAY